MAVGPKCLLRESLLHLKSVKTSINTSSVKRMARKYTSPRLPGTISLLQVLAVAVYNHYIRISHEEARQRNNPQTNEDSSSSIRPGQPRWTPPIGENLLRDSHEMRGIS